MAMDSFLLFALGAGFLWSFANVVDKLVLSDHIQDPLKVTFFTGLFGALAGLAVPILGIASFQISTVAISLLLGILYILPIYLYMKSISIGEVSRVVPVFSLSPLFVVVLETVFLQQRFSFLQYIGMLLAITGSVIVSSKRFGREFFRIESNKAFWLMFAGTVMFAGYSVGARWLLATSDYWNVFFWSRIGSVLPVLVLLFYTPFRKDIVSTVTGFKSSRIELLGLSELLNNLGVLAQTVALSLGPAALVTTAGSIQPLVVVALVGIVYLVLGKDLGEDLSKKALAVKTISGVLIVLGIYLIK